MIKPFNFVIKIARPGGLTYLNPEHITRIEIDTTPLPRIILTMSDGREFPFEGNDAEILIARIKGDEAVQ